MQEYAAARKYAKERKTQEKIQVDIRKRTQRDYDVKWMI